MYVLLAFALSIIAFFIVFDNASLAIGEGTSDFTSYIFNENFNEILLVEL